MAVDTDAIRVGTTGSLLVAPVGTTAPTTTVGGWAAGWVDVGALSEDGVTITPTMTVNPIRIWQSFYDVKRIVTSRALDYKFTLMERNAHNFILAMGGGSIVETGVGSGVWKYLPPDPSVIDERAFGLEVRENAIIDRYVMLRGMVTEFGDVPFRREDATMFELTVSTLVADGDEPWFMLSNDPAMEPA